jgi:hypothetical protein
MLNLDFSGIELQLKSKDGKTLVFDPVRKAWFILTPEEHIRQHILLYLINVQHYPKGMIALEKTIKVGNMNKRFDIVVYNRDHQPWMLIECKAPEVEITEVTLHQLLNYQRTIQCRFWMLTNGHQSFCADANDIKNIRWLQILPSYND